jgi:hypothetical protein
MVLNPFPSLSIAVSTQSPEHHCLHLLQLRRPPTRRGQPTPIHPAPLQPPRKLPLTSLMLPSHPRGQTSTGTTSPSIPSSPVSSCRRRALTSAPPPSNPTTPIASPRPAAATRPEPGRPPRREAPR